MFHAPNATKTCAPCPRQMRTESGKLEYFAFYDQNGDLVGVDDDGESTVIVTIGDAIDKKEIITVEPPKKKPRFAFEVSTTGTEATTTESTSDATTTQSTDAATTAKSADAAATTSSTSTTTTKNADNDTAYKPKVDKHGRLESIADVLIINLTKEIEEVEKKQELVANNMIPLLYATKTKGPTHDRKSRGDAVWIITKCHQYKKMHQVKDNLAIHYKVNFLTNNFKKEPAAHRGAVLSGFLNVKIFDPNKGGQPMTKADIFNYVLTFLPKCMTETFFNYMAALYHWIRSYTNNDQKQQEKFRLVKAVLEKKDYSTKDRENLTQIFAELVDWKKKDGASIIN
jgi:hypothetical protein